MAEDQEENVFIRTLKNISSPFPVPLQNLKTGLTAVDEASKSITLSSLPDPGASLPQKQTTPPVARTEVQRGKVKDGQIFQYDKITFDPSIDEATRNTFKSALDRAETVNNASTFDLASIDITEATQENLNKAMQILSTAQDVNTKLQAAITVDALAQQMTAYNMKRYTEQAGLALGIPELEQQVQASIQADLTSPNNPGDGTYSQQTQSLIDRRTQLNQNLPNLAIQYASIDPAVAAPSAAALAVLRQLPAVDRLEMARERARTKAAEVSTISDLEAKNYAAMSGQYRKIDWNSPVQVLRAKNTFHNNKEFQKLWSSGFLSIDSPEVARTMYSMTDDPIDKNRAFAVLERIEAEGLGIDERGLSSEERARRLLTYDENIRTFQAVFSGAATINNRPILSKEKEASINSQATVEGLTGNAKTQRVKELKMREYESALRTIAIDRFSSDVTRWKGINRTDPAVQSAFTEAKKATGKASIPLDVFVPYYLQQDTGEDYRTKLGRLNSYILSSANATNDSTIMPNIDGYDLVNANAPSTVRIWLNTILGK